MFRIRHHAARRHALATCLAAWTLLAAGTSAGVDESDPLKAAQAFRRAGQPVVAQSDATLIAEAEEFQVSQPGWQARPWGTNYYAATFANSFLSRKAYLGAAEQCDRSAATIEVQVPAAGRYLALVRYEAAHRFETRFRLEIEQNGKMVLDRLYGARDNVKIWAFGQKLKDEHAWPWGAVENMVWEGHDAHVNLEAGTARLTLVADRQPDNAARRNVDLVMLCSDAEQVARRIESESYLPLDGMLTQAGDLYLKLHNDSGGSQTTLTVNPGGEHSPYWVHLRNWQPKTLSAGPGESTEWVEVGSLLDSLNDGQWSLNPKGTGTLEFALEFGVRGPDGRIETIRRLDNETGDVALAYDADTRYTRRIRTAGEILYALLDYLKAQPVTGTAPQRTLVYGYTFDRREGDAKYNAAIEEFQRLFGLAPTQGNGEAGRSVPSGYIDVRGVPTDKLEEYCRNLQAEGKADRIAVVSLGDEIGLPAPPAADDVGFRAWLAGQNVPAGTDPSTLDYNPDPKAAAGNPVQYYFSRRYAHDYGIQALKQRTEILQKHLPNAGIGANYSPHHDHAYLGEVAQWVTTFREGGMTQPWSEDYIWQLPVGSQQMNFINLDLLRAGTRGKPDLKIHYYVMPHSPGNTPNSWRRQFYGDIAHGMKIVNLFEFRPVQAAYTENHVSLPQMYGEVRRGLFEMGQFEDIVQDGRVRPAPAALWFSEAADVWDDYQGSNAAAKRALYVAIRHQQVPLDFVVEADALSGALAEYQLLYLTDAHVGEAASRAIADWVAAGGRLFATAGAGLFDEFDRPNTVLRELFGVEADVPETPDEWEVRFIKQDLPFSQPIDIVSWQGPDGIVELPVVAVRGRCRAQEALVRGRFEDGSPAITVKTTGQGQATYCGFLPGLTYFKPAIPMRPVDRGSTDDSMAHLIPTDFDPAAAALMAWSAAGLPRPVICSEPLVEAGVVEAEQGLVIPLVNWSGKPIQGLKVSIHFDVRSRTATLASGKPVQTSNHDGQTRFTLDMDVADALIFR